MKRLSLGICAAVALLVGCGELQQAPSSVPSAARAFLPRNGLARPMPESTWVPTASQSSPRAGWLSRAAKAPGARILYVSQYYYPYSCSYYCNDVSSVLIYPEEGSNQKPIGTISLPGPPWGLFVDKHQNLFVTNQLGMVYKYPPNSTTPSVTYSQGLARPLYAIADDRGDVFVSNATSANGIGGTVVEYSHGRTDSYQVLQTPGNEADGMDFDKDGNLYVAYRTSSESGSIEEFAPGSTQGTVLGMSLRKPQGLVIDTKNGNILVVETGRASTNSTGPHVDVFQPGEQTPAIEIPIDNIPNQIALRHIEPKLFVAAEAGNVYGIGYPLRPKRQRIYVKETVSPILQGVAVSNPQHF